MKEVVGDMREVMYPHTAMKLRVSIAFISLIVRNQIKPSSRIILKLLANLESAI
jgi:hypothetical protein